MKIPARVFVDVDEILKFIWKGKGSRILQVTFKKNKVGRLHLPGFKTYYVYTRYSNYDCGVGRGIDPEISGTE